jgi:hypothetical protein
LHSEHIIPRAFNRRVAESLAEAVATATIASLRPRWRTSERLNKSRARYRIEARAFARATISRALA